MNGIVASLIAGVFLGFFQIFHGKGEGLPIRTATVLILAFSTVVVALMAQISFGIGTLFSLPVPAILLFAAAGAVHFVGGWLFIGLSQRRAGVGITGLLVGATPVFTAGIAWLILGERIDFVTIAGIALVITGVGVATWE